MIKQNIFEKRLSKDNTYFNSTNPFSNNNINENSFENNLFKRKQSSKNNNQDSWIEKIEPKITLIKIIDQCFYEGHLILTNKTNNYLVFKFKNIKQDYSITPILYFIKPKEAITINLKKFQRLSLDNQINMKDNIFLILAKSDTIIEDVNEAIIYLRKEDLYSPEYQVIQFFIEIDNGYNPLNSQKLIEKKNIILEEYNKQLNINNINSCEEVKKYINNIKNDIKDYKNKIVDLKSKLGDMTKNNIIKQSEVVFDKETFDKIHNLIKKDNNDYNDSISLSMFLFFISICLFIGKFLKSLFR